MTTFYKIDNGRAQVGSGDIIPEGFLEYSIYDEPKELTDALLIEQKELELQAWKASRLEAISKIIVETSTGKKFNGDEDSQIRMNRTWVLMKDGATTKWSLADTPTGFMTLVTKEELKEACILAGDAQTALWEYKE